MNPRTFRRIPARIAFFEGENGGGSSAPAETSAETPAEEPGTETPAETPAEEEAPGEGEGEGEGESVDDLPAWAQARLRRLGNENAARRKANEELTAKLAGAKTTEEFEAAVTELRNANASLEREAKLATVAHTHTLSAEALTLLEDVPTDKLEARAKALATLFGSPATTSRTPSGGLVPDDDDEGFDPVKAAAEARRRRY